MKNYRTLALRYLKMNKKRSRITICGVVITTVILFLILNLAESYLFQQQKEIREETDYEIILFTETEEQIAEVIADTRIRTAYVGSYVYRKYSFNEGWLTTNYDKALFVNLKNPYRILSIFETLCSTYGLEGEINDPLAETYFQSSEVNLMVVMILSILLVSFIFAIFGVGIVRNSIQLCILESIRDYGNLRCIGAAVGQLKSIIYAQGAILELTGIGIGIIIGTMVSMITGAFLHMKAGFHILPVLFILIVFLGDLYFAMQENCKLVVGMTPVSAIRGEYRIQKEKIRLRKNKLITKLFGVDGDYAYKSIMRNSRRFARTVFSMVFGVGALIAVVSFTGSLNHIITKVKENYGYYPIYFEGVLSPGYTIAAVESQLPPTESLERLVAQKEIIEGKRMYVSNIPLTDQSTKLDHYSEEIREVNSEMIKHLSELWIDREEKAYSLNSSGMICYGYDEADYQRYQSVLTEGTLDVSENGIVILNRGEVSVTDPDTGMEYTRNMLLTDYQLGDTIDFIDMEEMHNRLDKQVGELWTESQKEQAALYEQEWEDADQRYEAIDEVKEEYWHTVVDMVYNCWEELKAEGCYKTYTIEGIVSKDVNHIYNPQDWTDGCRIILPLDRYFELTGTDASMVTGMQYHLSRYPRNRSLTSLIEHDWNPVYGLIYSESAFPEVMDLWHEYTNGIYIVAAIIVFIMVMAALNIINATASNLHLRRQEFAQLRVIGVSRRHLMRMVMLEGIITTVVADVIGIAIGLGVAYLLFWYLTQIIYARFYFPLGTILLCVLGTGLLLCGSIYVSLRNMKQNMAEDLKTGGD